MTRSRIEAYISKAKSYLRAQIDLDRPFLEWIRQHTVGVRKVLARYFSVLFDREAPARRRARYALGGLAAIFGGMAGLLLLYMILLIPFTPGIATLEKARIEEPSVVLSADGEALTRYRRVNREWVPLEEISDHVVNALIATEDHRFYKHIGVDPIRILGAMWATVKGTREGGSTITQQLARNMFPDEIGRHITMRRKLKEMITAFKIEVAFEKPEILEAYLNTVPFYFGAYGIEMAARTYFGKSASNLNLLESATLVGMLKGTYYYNPVRNPERSLSRRNVALQQMVKRGYLDEDEFEGMKSGPIRLNFERQQEPGSLAPHFTEHIRMWLIDWADRNDYNIYRDSLVIYTTLNMDMQKLAQLALERQGRALQAVADVEWSSESARLRARDASVYSRYRNPSRSFDFFWSSRPELLRTFVRRTYEYDSGVASGVDESVMLDSLMANRSFVDSIKTMSTRLQAGFVAVDPETGHVKAWVGSRDFKEDQYDHVARARRQPGSTFKPFVYARALDEGFSPDDKLRDREVEIPLEGGYVWRPANAGETVSGREFTLTEGLVFSKNTITAQLVQEVGPRDVASLARRMGVNRSNLRPVPSLALGTSEVSLLEMVSAYATFANLGVYREPLIVTRIEDRRGRVLAEFGGRSRSVLSERTSRAVVDMMRGVVQRGTGNRIRTTFGITEDVAGKTGTTQNSADGWFILMHPKLVAGSWMGFNDPRVTFRSDYWGQGGNNALLIVGDFFRQALRSGAIAERDAKFPPPPEYDDKPSVFARAWRWVREQVESAWGALFGRIDREEPEQTDTYVADRGSGGVQINLPDDSEAIADSLTRLERDRNRLDSIRIRFPQGREEAMDTMPDGDETQDRDEDQDEEREEDRDEDRDEEAPPNRPENRGNPDGEGRDGSGEGDRGASRRGPDNGGGDNRSRGNPDANGGR